MMIWKVLPPRDKNLIIQGPECSACYGDPIYLCLDFDDVDHDKMMKLAEKIAKVLNEGWEKKR